MLAGDLLGDEIFWLTLEYVTRNMEKVLILSEKNTKMSPPQWIACQLHMSRIKLAAPDWSMENSRPITWRGSLVLMTTTLLRRSWNKTSSTIHELKRRAWASTAVSESEPVSECTYGDGILSVLPCKDEGFSRQFFAWELLTVYSWRARKQFIDSEQFKFKRPVSIFTVPSNANGETTGSLWTKCYAWSSTTSPHARARYRTREHRSIPRKQGPLGEILRGENRDGYH